MTVSRSWTWIDETKIPENDDDIRPILDDLANQWSSIQSEIENEGFRRQAAIEDGEDPMDHFDTELEYEEWRKKDNIRKVLRDTKLNVIEGILEKYNARMMRPYEHWNEDERYVEYMENRFD